MQQLQHLCLQNSPPIHLDCSPNGSPGGLSFHSEERMSLRGPGSLAGPFAPPPRAEEQRNAGPLMPSADDSDEELLPESDEGSDVGVPDAAWLGSDHGGQSQEPPSRGKRRGSASDRESGEESETASPPLGPPGGEGVLHDDDGDTEACRAAFGHASLAERPEATRGDPDGSAK